MSAPQPRPITILIAALGGEGGGVHGLDRQRGRAA
jgi:hypothetical protein